MDSESDNEDTCNLPTDEVREIRRAMRVAQARKQAVSQQMKHKLDKNSADQYELESMLRKQGAELSRTKTLLSQSDFDLKEARFEINQILARETQLKEEKRLVEVKNAEIIADLKAKLEQKSQSQEEKTQVAVFECDKMIKTLSALYKSVFDGRNSNTTAPKTSKQLLDKATSDAEHLREFLKSKSSSLLSEEQEKVTTAMHARHHTVSVESGCDGALLDMCRSLEEENRALSDTVEALRAQLAETSRDASINRLIPHYRLAIVRSRTYAANLVEQIKREQATSATLRDQLDATYADLKKAVEEKRALFTRMSKLSLQAEERESYLAHQRGVDEQRILRDVAETLAQSPLRASGSSASTAPVSAAARFTQASAVGRGGGAVADEEEEESTRHATATQKRVESKYLRSLVDDAHDTTPAVREAAPRPASAHPVEPLTKPSQHLKAELSQLDSEIEELKVKLGKAAMLKSQRILNEVLDAHVPAL